MVFSGPLKQAVRAAQYLNNQQPPTQNFKEILEFAYVAPAALNIRDNKPGEISIPRVLAAEVEPGGNSFEPSSGNDKYLDGAIIKNGTMAKTARIPIDQTYQTPTGYTYINYDFVKDLLLSEERDKIHLAVNILMHETTQLQDDVTKAYIDEFELDPKNRSLNLIFNENGATIFKAYKNLSGDVPRLSYNLGVETNTNDVGEVLTKLDKKDKSIFETNYGFGGYSNIDRLHLKQTNSPERKRKGKIFPAKEELVFQKYQGNGQDRIVFSVKNGEVQSLRIGRPGQDTKINIPD